MGRCRWAPGKAPENAYWPVVLAVKSENLRRFSLEITPYLTLSFPRARCSSWAPQVSRERLLVLFFLPLLHWPHLVTVFSCLFSFSQLTRITRDPSPNGPEQLTPDSRFWSLKRSFILTGIWPGGDGLRLPTLFVSPKGKSKSGFKTDGWNGRKTTNYQTPRADRHQPAICKASRRTARLTSRLYKRGKKVLRF